MRVLSHVLLELIDTAQEVAARRSMTAGGFAPDRLHTLAAEIRAADALPAEGIRTTRAGVMMVIALEAFRASDREPSSPWLGVIGVILPVLRADAWLALKNEKEARPS